MANIKKTFTKEAHQKMLEQLDYLKTVREREVADKLKEARSFGDLSENAEYDAAKDEQAAVAAEIDKIESMLSNHSGRNGAERRRGQCRLYCRSEGYKRRFR